MLRYRSAAVAAALVLILAISSSNAQQGKGAWQGYRWTDVAYTACPGPAAHIDRKSNTCLAFDQRWDAKKRQHVVFRYQVMPDGQLNMRLGMLNRDPIDGDTVCFTALWNDANGNTLFSFHQRWGMNARSHNDRPFFGFLPPAAWSQVRQVSMGLKECNRIVDQAVWKAVIAVAAAVCTAATGDAGSCGKGANLANQINEGTLKP